MEKENIRINIGAHVNGDDNPLHDYRSIVVQGTRGEVIKKLDQICTEIEAEFET